MKTSVDRMLESAAVRLQETAAMNQIQEVQSLARWLGFTTGWKYLKFGRVVCGYKLADVRWGDVVAAAKQIQKAADPKYFYATVQKKNQSVWLAAPYANGVELQMEMLPDWGVMLFIFNKSTTKSTKYLQDAIGGKGSKGSKKSTEQTEE